MFFFERTRIKFRWGYFFLFENNFFVLVVTRVRMANVRRSGRLGIKFIFFCNPCDSNVCDEYLSSALRYRAGRSPFFTRGAVLHFPAPDYSTSDELFNLRLYHTIQRSWSTLTGLIHAEALINASRLDIIYDNQYSKDAKIYNVIEKLLFSDSHNGCHDSGFYCSSYNSRYSGIFFKGLSQESFLKDFLDKTL